MTDIVKWLTDEEFSGPMQHLRDWSEIDKRHAEAAKEIENLKGALRDDAERLQMAGDRVDLATGCDTADAMADEIEHLRFSLSEARATGRREAGEECSKMLVNAAEQWEMYDEYERASEFRDLADAIRAAMEKAE